MKNIFKRGEKKTPSFKVAKLNGIGIKDFFTNLKAMINKKDYLAAALPFAGYFIIWLALSGIGLYYAYTLLMTLSMSIMYIMYGLMSMAQVLMVVLEFLLLLFIVIAVGFFFYALCVGVQFAYQAKLRNPDKQVVASTIWNRFKHVRKNQLLRLCLYSGLFILLWRLPLTIVGDIWGSNKIVYYTVMTLNSLILLWKVLQYSQAVFLYREKQPEFLGQSMRHALTFSKRFMAGFKLNYLAIMFLFNILPALVWGGLTGGLIYYGVYTATNPCIWIGAILFIVGFGFLMPYFSMINALYFEMSSKKIKMENVFADTFKPVEVLTGEAYDD